MKIIVEGWRFIPHSYAIINHFQLLEMLKRPELKLFHRDMPFVKDIWKPVKGLLDPVSEIKLRQLPSPPNNCKADVTLRMYCPFNLACAKTPQTVMFGCTEWGVVPPSIISGMKVDSFQEAHANSNTTIVTSSHWSRKGFIYSGADPDRVVVVPLGVDPQIYKPLSSDKRRKLRQKLGWNDFFIFFNSGVMWNQRQGVDGLLKAFASIVDRYPEARLVFKGRDHIFPSRQEILQASKNALSDRELENVKPRVIYIGGNLSNTEVAELYQAADVYVSSYLAEGFNLPVLEAAACGLPVICTEGGPTDDFTHPDFTWGIDSQLTSLKLEGAKAFAIVPSLDRLMSLMQEIVDARGFCDRARKAGPKWVHNRFTWKHTVDRLLQVFAQNNVETPNFPSLPTPNPTPDTPNPTPQTPNPTPIPLLGGVRGGFPTPHSHKIIVEGWRNLPHSYALINHFQLLELLKRPNVELFHRDMPYFQPDKQPISGLFDLEAEKTIAQIESATPNQTADATLRMFIPPNFAPSNSKITAVFGCTEWGIVTKAILNLMGVDSFSQAYAKSDAIMITSSHWSKQGFVRSGADPDRVVVIPLGVDPTLYKPLPRQERQALRQELGWDDYFIFLNNGVLWRDRQGISFLLKAFSTIVDRYPHARLVIKGRDYIFPSKRSLEDIICRILTETELAKVLPRLIYIGESLSCSKLAQLYQIADAYVSPYLAEGFNLPVLEAAACGLPAICTKGGATDDFIDPSFALTIASEARTFTLQDETGYAMIPSLDHLIDLMYRVIDQPSLCDRAYKTGPQWVHSRFTWKHTIDKVLKVLEIDDSLLTTNVETPNFASLPTATPTSIPLPGGARGGLLQPKPQHKIVVEGWRNIPHSYAMVNQFQLLALCDRPNIEIFHRDVPYLRPYWQPIADLFDPTSTSKLQKIPLPPNETVDAILRMSIPYNLKPGNAKKTCVFCTTEAGIVTQAMLSGMGAASMPEALEHSDVTLITPSRWSRQGFLRSGVHPNRVVVIPHGVNADLYKPLPEEERTKLRKEFGIDDCFVFLNIGILSDNKGIRPLLKAFAQVVDRYPQARLLLKGADSLFESTKFLTNSAKAALTDAEAAKVESRLAYIGKNLSIPELIRLYQAADAYLSPYLAEGFNLPVLEAAACGLPVICTQGGPTDDFTRPEFALQVSSQIKPIDICGETVFLLEPNLSHLVEQMEWAIAHREYRLTAREFAPEFIGKYFTWDKIVDQLLTVLIDKTLN